MLVVGCVAGLAGCAGSVAPEIKRLPERVELSGTFYRGVANQSGPQVLASMLSQQGIVITPGLLEKPLHLPGAEAQLQQNMQNLAREYATKNVRVNVLCPGFFPAEQNRKLLFNDDGTPTARTKSIWGHTPMNRFGDSHELIGAAVFLAAPKASSFITGTDIRVDGGYLSQTI